MVKCRNNNSGARRYGSRRRRGWPISGTDMEAFDRLPAEVRQALANANVRWSSKSALRFVEMRLPVPWIIEQIRKGDADAAQKTRVSS